MLSSWILFLLAEASLMSDILDIGILGLIAILLFLLFLCNPVAAIELAIHILTAFFCSRNRD